MRPLIKEDRRPNSASCGGDTAGMFTALGPATGGKDDREAQAVRGRELLPSPEAFLRLAELSRGSFSRRFLSEEEEEGRRGVPWPLSRSDITLPDKKKLRKCRAATLSSQLITAQKCFTFRTPSDAR
ncbi:hypothetical protein E2C01_040085 [Portunus trituberculatus]|uniref:Uncharacterized protein n=1 Tax=Portunus trituberculatus TaxID=210409 RepID=A0A5B7FLI4_PORTR|nr:hypothetical protein [Portunus trituberculatus]